MAEESEQARPTGVGGLLKELPLDSLKAGFQDLLESAGERAAGYVTDKVDDLTERLMESANNGGAGLVAALTGGKKLAAGGSPVGSALSAGFAGAKEKVAQALGSGGSKGGKKGKSKVVNIIEHNDVGLPLRVVYDQWTRFEDFPNMTKKVLSVDQEADEKVNWKAKIFLSTRGWESSIIEQVPDERIVWTSKGAKGTVDGAVTFHELTPNLTRILLVIEYYPQGFFEKTGNLWRAQGRRVRADFKYIKRHMMTRTILEQDKVEGWRGEIRDREVVKTHEEALREEEERELDSGEEEPQGYREDEAEAEEDEYRDSESDEADYSDEAEVEADDYQDEGEYQEEGEYEAEERRPRRQPVTSGGRRR